MNVKEMIKTWRYAVVSLITTMCGHRIGQNILETILLIVFVVRESYENPILISFSILKLRQL